MLKNMTFKNVLDLVRWHVRLSVRVYQTDEGLIVWVPLWCPTADESRSAVFMETSCLRSSVIHKSKHRFFFFGQNVLNQTQAEHHQWALSFVFSGNIVTTLHHITSTWRCRQPSGAPPAVCLVPVTLSIFFEGTFGLCFCFFFFF